MGGRGLPRPARVIRLAVAAAVGLTVASAAAARTEPLAAQGAPGGPGWIGLSVDLIQSWRAGGLPASAPVMVVANVHPGSPAARAGFQTGDTLLRLNDQAAAPEALARLQATLVAGRQVRLTVRREGRVQTVSLQAASRPADELLHVLSPRLRSVVDSVHMAVLQNIDSTVRVQLARVAAEPVVFSQSFLRALPDTQRALAAWGTEIPSSSFRSEGFVGWNEPALPSPASLDSIVARYAFQSAQAGQETRRLASELTTLQSRVETAARGQFSVRGVAPPASVHPQPPQDEHRRPLAPYIIGHDWIAGARVTPLNPALGDYFGVERGLLVVDVAARTPAADAGLVPGDVVVRAGTRDLSTLEELRAALTARTGPATLPLTLVRKGRRLEVALAR